VRRHALADFCKEWQLTINCAKTKVVVFRNPKTAIMVPSQGLLIDGSVLKIVDHFKYLGLCLHRAMQCIPWGLGCQGA
jgi:hypothetical protein